MNKTIAIHETFNTINGEGYQTGRPTTFIRVVGCNLACFYCDTGYASEETRKKIPQENYTMRELLKRYEYLNLPYVCFTGGEPLLYADFLYEFIQQATDTDWHIPVDKKWTFETNGTIPITLDARIRRVLDITYTMDVKPFAYSRFMSTINNNLSALEPSLGDEVKIVITNAHDLELADEIINKWSWLEYILSPVHDAVQNKFLTGDLVCDYIKQAKKTNVRVGIQTHKYLGQR